ncbi:MAG: GNAT family N-acetyltransferase [Clostridia bacterium]|nr:GNAT family N-acetyltransferase [Clostridia bacterium]
MNRSLQYDIEFIKVSDRAQLVICQDIIRNSFATAAHKHGLTQENCPSHTSFIKLERLERQFDEGRPMFIVKLLDELIGYYSLSAARDREIELNNLSVLPAYRNKGIGKRIVDHAKVEAKSLGADTLLIGIIDKDQQLKSWYQKQGFIQFAAHNFQHLPFTVGYLSCKL